MTPHICRREGHDPQRPQPSDPLPNDPIEETPHGAEPGPGPEPDEPWTPGRDGEPILEN